jgi:hypothetical protein
MFRLKVFVYWDDRENRGRGGEESPKSTASRDRSPVIAVIARDRASSKVRMLRIHPVHVQVDDPFAITLGGFGTAWDE